MKTRLYSSKNSKYVWHWCEVGSDGASVEKEELGRVCVYSYRVQEEGGCTWL